VDLPTALEVIFDEVRERLLTESASYKDSEFKSELNEWITGSRRAPGGADPYELFKYQQKLAHLYIGSAANESDYLIHAAQWFFLARCHLEDGDYLNALTKLMRAQENIGAMNGINALRRENAAKANKENAELKEQAVKYWQDHIDPKLSNDKAAAILAGQVPLSVRVLSRYVSEAKKELKELQEFDKRHREYIEQTTTARKS
jgi:hypothetical protein